MISVISLNQKCNQFFINNKKATQVVCLAVFFIATATFLATISDILPKGYEITVLHHNLPVKLACGAVGLSALVDFIVMSCKKSVATGEKDKKVTVPEWNTMQSPYGNIQYAKLQKERKHIVQNPYSASAVCEMFLLDNDKCILGAPLLTRESTARHGKIESIRSFLLVHDLRTQKMGSQNLKELRETIQKHGSAIVCTYKNDQDFYVIVDDVSEDGTVQLRNPGRKEIVTGDEFMKIWPENNRNKIIVLNMGDENQPLPV